MGIGVYLCWLGSLYLIILLLVPRLRPRMGIYGVATLISGMLILILFVLLSAGVGLMRFGQPFNLSIPQDYIQRGWAGYLLLIIPALGLLSPAIVAFLLVRLNHGRKGV
ncbi:MAG: hypothetical protein ACM3PY_10275 [Omnitrophica WOR_2 bacterium]